jgi:hypothetical protein
MWRVDGIQQKVWKIGPDLMGKNEKRLRAGMCWTMPVCKRIRRTMKQCVPGLYAERCVPVSSPTSITAKPAQSGRRRLFAVRSRPATTSNLPQCWHLQSPIPHTVLSTTLAHDLNCGHHCSSVEGVRTWHLPHTMVHRDGTRHSTPLLVQDLGQKAI